MAATITTAAAALPAGTERGRGAGGRMGHVGRIAAAVSGGCHYRRMVEYGADTREPVLLGEILHHVFRTTTARSRRPPCPERAPARTHGGDAAPETGTAPPPG
ncbi:hypothetical protein ABZY02_05310 [Streptomyces sp. NPDC006649]|uniref:hypothetical protein n=2 Tax=unclassified Streptomyces TaxID=2593676 RepID=UPI0033A8420A